MCCSTEQMLLEQVQGPQGIWPQHSFILTMLKILSSLSSLVFFHGENSEIKTGGNSLPSEGHIQGKWVPLHLVGDNGTVSISTARCLSLPLVSPHRKYCKRTCLCRNGSGACGPNLLCILFPILQAS